jgi:hypothetical protein
MPSSSATALRVFQVVFTFAAIVLVGFSGLVGGWQGSVATITGLVGTTVYLYGTWVVVKATGAPIEEEGPRKAQVGIIVLFLLMKLPLIYAGWVLSQSLGPFGPTGFLLGLALVYCAMVWRAVLAVRD